jgi:16S rRNA (guanine966-N2)-methyltransferase
VRIVGGHLSGRSLRAPRGQTTRPTSDKVRQAIFNILFSRDAPMVKVLDLYAGSGALGLEAISRGAGHVDFVESDRHAADAIVENAKALGVDAQIRVFRDKVAGFKKRLCASERDYDLVFIDPPYADRGAQQLALDLASEVLAEGGLVVLEQESMDQPFDELPHLQLVDRRVYGQTAIALYQPRGSDDG